MTERLRNGQMVGIISKEDPDKDEEFKIKMARIVHYGKMVRIAYDKKPISSEGPISSIKGLGIQYTFPQLSPYLK